MNNEKEIESEIVKHAYVAPCVESMQVQTEWGLCCLFGCDGQ